MLCYMTVLANAGRDDRLKDLRPTFEREPVEVFAMFNLIN